MNDKDFTDYDLKLAEWRGYTVRTLVDMNENIKELNIKVDKMNDNLTNLKIKVAMIGGTSGLIVSIIMFLLTKVV